MIKILNIHLKNKFVQIKKFSTFFNLDLIRYISNSFPVLVRGSTSIVYHSEDDKIHNTQTKREGGQPWCNRDFHGSPLV